LEVTVMTNGIHVMQKDGNWAVMRGNYTLDEFESQQQAIQLGKQKARASKATLTVHAEDGSVRLVENYQSSEGSLKRDKVRRTA
jgi:VCBS repeat-containing protein